MRDALTGLPEIPVVLSTSSVYPEKTPDAFQAAARLGYDGVEVMVYTDPVSQSADALARLVDYHQMPVLAVHAPGLLLTQLVWGREPWSKLIRAKDLAERLGAKVVVVHPPFLWQREYTRGFVEGITRMSEETDVIFAVENMFPIRAGASEVSGYAPHWDPARLDVPNVTLDLSHTAASASDAMVMANDIGTRLAHIHLADGTGVSSGPVPIEPRALLGRLERTQKRPWLVGQCLLGDLQLQAGELKWDYGKHEHDRGLHQAAAGAGEDFPSPARRPGRSL